MINTMFMCFFLSVFASLAYAAFPVNLMIEDKPIDALCFFNLESDKSEVNLKHCGLKKEKYVMKGQNADLIKKGYIGYNWQDPELQGAMQGYSYYRYFKASNHQFWLYTVNSGGGSGDFTAINLVKRKNADSLEVKTLKSGDRCNGGIQNVLSKENKLLFSVNLTAYDLVALSKRLSKSVKAYDDLASCAVCCVAKAYYEVSANAAPILKFVDLGQNRNIKELPEQGARQACFNKLFVSFINTGVTRLNSDQLSLFVDKFNKLCVHKG